MTSYGKELEAGRAAARAAGDLALGIRAGGIEFDSKPDDSPVTVADREAERLISRMLLEAFPEDGLLGEEGAAREGASGRRWIIDPIDGTRDFVRGNPNWAVLIGLEDRGRVAAGFAYLPGWNQMYFAAAGTGAFCNDTPIRCSAVKDAGSAVLCVNGLNNMTRYPFCDRLPAWMSSFWAVRSMGGCLDAVMIARGQADLWLEPTAKPWDLAALKIIAQEAGARFFDFTGEDTIYGGNCVVCAPGLEGEARRFLEQA